MRNYIKTNWKKFGLLLIYLIIANCSSKLSLLRERLRPIDSIPDRGVLEISLNNEENKKIETINIHGLLIYDQDLVKKTNINPLFLQGHEGELYVNSPYEIKISPGEYFGVIISTWDLFNRHDLTFNFGANFGFYYDSSGLVIDLNNKESVCQLQTNTIHRCQQIIIKKDTKTRIIIKVQKPAPINSSIDIRTTSGARPIPLPYIVKTRETPEVLIEVQNPK
ncbi:hypothetical protein V6Z05_06145 [Leptospira venezuelensis]|uniref:hypothetical protein n=1 Tax=Leptospira venezuelensis TaxID=1958811 RepID=UPI000A392250|nr:hypothetical protein [Leptospira venezuelensis]